jgi:hypothetical protein
MRNRGCLAIFDYHRLFWPKLEVKSARKAPMQYSLAQAMLKGRQPMMTQIKREEIAAAPGKICQVRQPLGLRVVVQYRGITYHQKT